MSNLRKITHGISGTEAATIIYDNDKSLEDRVSACESSLETNKAYAAQVNKGGRTLITVTSLTGTSTTDVMSQYGVTEQVEQLNDKIDDMAMLSNIKIDDNITYGPNHDVVNADYALKAALDGEGHTISDYYYNIQDLYDKISNLEKRIIALENK